MRDEKAFVESCLPIYISTLFRRSCCFFILCPPPVAAATGVLPRAGGVLPRARKTPAIAPTIVPARPEPCAPPSRSTVPHPSGGSGRRGWGPTTVPLTLALTWTRQVRGNPRSKTMWPKILMMRDASLSTGWARATQRLKQSTREAPAFDTRVTGPAQCSSVRAGRLVIFSLYYTV